MITEIKQICFDRAIIITLSSSNCIYNLIIEIYGTGNILLTDEKYNIIIVLREQSLSTVTSMDNSTTKYGIYPILSYKSLPESITKSFIKSCCQEMITNAIENKDILSPPTQPSTTNINNNNIVDSKNTNNNIDFKNINNNTIDMKDSNKKNEEKDISTQKRPRNKRQERLQKQKEDKLRKKEIKKEKIINKNIQKNPNDTNKKNQQTIFDALSSSIFGPQLTTHALLLKNIPFNININEILERIENDNDTIIISLIDGLQICLNQIQNIQDIPVRNLLYYKEIPIKDSKDIVTTETPLQKVYVDFTSIELQTTKKISNDILKISMPTLWEACDQYYSNFAYDKAHGKHTKDTKQVTSKIQRVMDDNKKKQNSILEKIEYIERVINLIYKYDTILEKYLQSLSLFIQKNPQYITKITQDGFNLPEIEKNFKLKKLDIINKTVEILLLDDTDIDTDKNKDNNNIDIKNIKEYTVELEYTQTIYKNIKRLYDECKEYKRRYILTKESLEYAVQQVEKKTQKKQQKIKDTKIRIKRKTYWFEKFHWFISDENILVIAGRDIQQNETLVKKYLDINDIYMHADIHGAASIIIKNPIPNISPLKTISIRTLQQATIFTLVNSKIWNERQTNQRCYWVYAKQVSKIPPSGMYLSPGSFMIRGTKNYITQIPPLLMGLGICFRLNDNDSIQRHIDDRKVHSSSLYDVSLGAKIWEEMDEKHNDTLQLQCIDVQKKLENISTITDTPTSKATAKTTCVVPVSKWQNSTNTTQIYEKKPIKHSRKWKERMRRYQLQDEDDKIKAKELYGIVFSSNVVNEQSNIDRGARDRSKYSEDNESEAVYEDQDLDENEYNEDGDEGEYSEDGDEGEYSEDHEDEDEDENEDEDEDENEDENDEYNEYKDEEENTQDIHEADAVSDGTLQVTKNIDTIWEKQWQQAREKQQQEQKHTYNILQEITGIPTKEDDQGWAIPMCAPYDALNHFTFKVPLIYGTDKKGHVIQRASQLFNKTIKDKYLKNNENVAFSKVLTKLLSSIEECEYNLSLISNCKINEIAYRDVTTKQNKR